MSRYVSFAAVNAQASGPSSGRSAVTSNPTITRRSPTARATGPPSRISRRNLPQQLPWRGEGGPGLRASQSWWPGGGSVAAMQQRLELALHVVELALERADRRVVPVVLVTVAGFGWRGGLGRRGGPGAALANPTISGPCCAVDAWSQTRPCSGGPVVGSFTDAGRPPRRHTYAASGVTVVS